MPAQRTIRLLHDPPLDGPTNMARDEALMTQVGRLESPPTLRLYQWDPPTISLGYFQHFADYESLPPPAGGLPVVRRLTGGGAILHDLELTYSLTLSGDHHLAGAGPNRLYELVHNALIECLGSLGLTAKLYGTRRRDPPAVENRTACVLDDKQNAARAKAPQSTGTSAGFRPLSDARLPVRCTSMRAGAHGRTQTGGSAVAGASSSRHGPFFCFQRRHRFDVLIGCDKIAGSAQRRTRDAVLQHGSIILGRRYDQQKSATAPLEFEDAVRRIRASFPDHLERAFGEGCRPGDWTTAELTTAGRLAVTKYACDAWTKRT